MVVHAGQTLTLDQAFTRIRLRIRQYERKVGRRHSAQDIDALTNIASDVLNLLDPADREEAVNRLGDILVSQETNLGEEGEGGTEGERTTTLDEEEDDDPGKRGGNAVPRRQADGSYLAIGEEGTPGTIIGTDGDGDADDFAGGTPGEDDDEGGGTNTEDLPGAGVNDEDYPGREFAQRPGGKAVTKPGLDETTSEFRYRLRDPKQFQPNTFRTITIQEKKPQVNGIVGKLKKDGDDAPMTLQGLRFPKSEGWTKGEVREWIKAHPDVGRK
ncbi:MAG: hypothetical protein ACREEC_08385, partial [Thermoplasmata archaeon]